ncbi:MAG: hypothetical protein CMI29_08245 [Opitutae bacterium]|nr:hypothetical protein [Opitutae bacterium]
MLGPRAIKRQTQGHQERITNFTSTFLNFAPGSGLSDAEDNLMNAELDRVRDTLALKGPAELALLEAIALAPPNPDGNVVIDDSIVVNARAEFAAKEFSLYVLRGIWKLDSTRRYLATKMISRHVLEVIVSRLSVQMFAEDLRNEVLATLEALTVDNTGTLLMRSCLVLTENRANQLVPELCSFVNAGAQTADDLINTTNALWLLYALTDDRNDIFGHHPEESDKFEEDWARAYFGAADDSERLGVEDDPNVLAREAIAATDGAIEKLLAVCEMATLQQGTNASNSLETIFLYAIGTLEEVVDQTENAVVHFAVDLNGLERIMRVFYWPRPVHDMRARILNILCIILASSFPGRIDQFQTMLPALFAHWRHVSETVPPQSGEYQLWSLMSVLSNIESLKNMLLLSDDCYFILRSKSDRPWNGNSQESPLLQLAYNILSRVLIEPTTPQMWQRFTEEDRGIYWGESILNDLLQLYGNTDNVQPFFKAGFHFKLNFACTLLQNKDQFLDVAFNKFKRFKDAVAGMVKPLVYALYHTKLVTVTDNSYLPTLKVLASHGSLWRAISNEIDSHNKNGDLVGGSWSLVVEALNDDNVLVQAATAEPDPDPVAALLLLHKMNEAHETLLSTVPLSKEDHALLEQRQAQYEPVLQAIESQERVEWVQYAEVLKKAVAFARTLLLLPSTQNPQLDAFREKYPNKRSRLIEDNSSTSTAAPTSTGAAFVSMLTRLSRPLTIAAHGTAESPATAIGDIF